MQIKPLEWKRTHNQWDATPHPCIKFTVLKVMGEWTVYSTLFAYKKFGKEQVGKQLAMQYAEKFYSDMVQSFIEQ